MNFSKIIVSGMLIVAMLLAGCSSEDEMVVEKLPQIQMTIGNEVFDIEVADNDLERTQGMMYRKQMGRNEGMLFVFPDSKPLTFHMNNCFIDLDGVFINSSGRVINIEYMRYPRSGSSDYYHSKSASQYVIELPAGTAARVGLIAGDLVQIPSKQNLSEAR